MEHSMAPEEPNADAPQQANEHPDDLVLYPSAHELPPRPLPANECNYVHYFCLNVDGIQGHDHYIYRHANGLCVIGLAPSHKIFQTSLSITAVDYNVGKQNRAEMKVTGKRKRDARLLDASSVLCKVITKDAFFLVRCCVKGALLEVNERLIKDPGLLNKKAATEGHIAIIMPKPEDWARTEKTLISRDKYLALQSV